MASSNPTPSPRISVRRASSWGRVFFAVIASAWAVPASAQEPSSATSPSADAGGIQGEAYSLAVGQTLTISAKGVKNWNEGVPGIAETKLTPDGKSFVINARKAGATTLLLIYLDGRQITHNITVWPKPPQVVEREVTQLTDSIAGVRRRRVGARVIIDGQVVSEADFKRIQQIAQLYQGQVESLVTMAPGGLGEGSPDAEDDPLLIRVDVYFVQYDRRSAYQFGLNMPGALGVSGQLSAAYDLAGATSPAANLALANQPLPTLDIAANRGWAKVLKHSTLVTENGVEANFNAGGEQLFAISAGLSAGVERVRFGSEVTIFPKYRPDIGILEMKVGASVSELADPGEGTKLPSRITSNTSTNVRLKLGQAVMLSGFRSKTQNHRVAGIPILSQLPILGVLFGSHGDRETESEGAVLIVPSVVTSLPKPAAELVDAAMATFNDYSGEIEHVNSYPATPPSALSSSKKKGANKSR